MSFTDYLYLKKNFLIWWFVIHGFALFVNLIKIEDDFWISHSRTSVNLFSDYDNRSERHFWPFVEFYYDIETYNREDGLTKTSYFEGIFYQYDISEFIAYSILVFLLLYFKFEETIKQSK